jgi:maltooligosyltrehalose trehalohydrolase
MESMRAVRPPTKTPYQRRFPLGAEVVRSGGVHFRVWAPRWQQAAVALFAEGTTSRKEKPLEVIKLQSERDGWFSGLAPSALVGATYGFRLGDDQQVYPDPASRFQPDGPHGLSQVVDPDEFEWTDQDWSGVQLAGQIIYEMHIGTFTPEGTFAAAQEQLPELAECGITLIEVMPLADFPGRFGWGYDGVNLFAPTRLYGTPDDFRRFVDRAHGLGIGVILDVVYNHLGPDGNFLSQFSDDYFTDRYATDWGQAINFEGTNAEPVREFYLSNALLWIREYHLDGLRLDATQDIHDQPQQHILAELTRRCRAAAGDRSLVFVGENEPQELRLIQSYERGGYALDALWNDDFHHSAMVRLTGRSEAYYTDYRGTPQEFISAMKYGYLYQGQWYDWQGHRRGHYLRGVAPAAFVTFIQNHDQVANSASGLRCVCLASPGDLRAMTALMLLGPGTPMLFQGQEFGATSPFYFFADHPGELGQKVHAGRKEFMSQFRSLKSAEMQQLIPDPSDWATFEQCKLDFSQREEHADLYQLHRDLLQLRREEPVFRAQRFQGLDGAVLAADALVLRYYGNDDLGRDDRLVVVNFGGDLHLSPSPEPLLAPPQEHFWEVIWSSEDPRYGGCGAGPLDTEENWRIPAHAAVVLRPETSAGQSGGEQ